MQTSKCRVRAMLAPEGRLKVAINYGNPVLASAARMASRWGLGLWPGRAGGELDWRWDSSYDAAGSVVADLEHADWRLAFMARDPKRAPRRSTSPRPMC
ncbi:hypothetical protein [Salinicola tamaricis]|uniref:hypothetical protein n=1 Tax=Salinicola tamaricis TaxID=1771309 RepID=UPI001A9188DD|nr:hypothetical protein [Salinicola tamaricis]